MNMRSLFTPKVKHDLRSLPRWSGAIGALQLVERVKLGCKVSTMSEDSDSMSYSSLVSPLKYH